MLITHAAQRGIGGITGFVQNVVVGARHHLLHNGGGQPLFDLVGLRSIDEGGNGNGLDVCGKRDGMAGSVISAGRGEEQDQQHRKAIGLT